MNPASRDADGRRGQRNRLAFSSRGSCFGFRVLSPLPFHYVRNGNGQPLKVVELHDEGSNGQGELLVEWTPGPGRPLHARLFQDRSMYRLWVSGGGGWFGIDVGRGVISLPKSANVVQREELLWSIPAALCMLHRRDLPIHSATVEVNGTALLLAGPGRFGKTTLTAAFMQAGHRPLSEDLSCVCPAPSPAIIPGPAMLRMRREMFTGCPPAGTRIVAESPGRISLALESRLRGDCHPVPLGAIVLLRKSAGEIRFQRLRPTEALPDLWALSFRLPSDAGHQQCFDGVSALVRSVAVWNFHRPLKPEALAESVDRIIAQCVP